MAHRELRIDYDKIRDPNTISTNISEEMARRDLDIHRDEVDELIDDHDKEQRILKVQPRRKYFFTKG